MNQPNWQVGEYDPALAELARDGDGDDEVSVIARHAEGDPLPDGVRVVTRFGEIVTLRVPRSRIAALAEWQSVTALEIPSRLEPTIDAYLEDEAVALEGAVEDETGTDAPEPYTRRPDGVTATGRDVVVGVMDWGLDVGHKAFINADGSTRFLAIWDQRGKEGSGPGNRWGYGRILTADAINRALHTDQPYDALDYDPSDADGAKTGDAVGSHGTHVLDIAAGNGRGGGLAGVAPDALLVGVELGRTTEVLGPQNLGDSASVLEALDCVFSIAGDRPCVVNMSVGAHGGPHDGRTLVEQGIDRALWLGRGRAVVNSAGNYFTSRAHAAGRLTTGEDAEIPFIVPAGDPTASELEVWYSGRDRFVARVTDPAGTEIARVTVGQNAPLVVDGHTVGHVYHVRNHTNGEHHIDLFFKPRAPGGTWTLALAGETVRDGRYHAWIERERGARPRFAAASVVTTSTTGTLCNGRLSITVGAYNPHKADRPIGVFSSAGPTADGRVKPECVAPGVRIEAARSTPAGERPGARYTEKGGTSMAAPHVTGAIALMFEAADRPLDIADTRALLFASCERKDFTGSAPTGSDVHRFGYGYLDIAAAERAARAWGRHPATADAAELSLAATAAESEEHEEDMDPMDTFIDVPSAPSDLLDDVVALEPMGDTAAPEEAGDSIDTFSDASLPPLDLPDDVVMFEPVDQDAVVDQQDDVAGDEGEDDVIVSALDAGAAASGTRAPDELRSRILGASPPVTSVDRLHEVAFATMGVANDDPLHVIGQSGARLTDPARPGDLLVRSAPIQGGVYSAVILSLESEHRTAIEARGVPVERGGNGTYVEVLEVPPSGGSPRGMGRRLTDSWGRIPRGQTLLRAPETTSATGAVTEAVAWPVPAEEEVEWTERESEDTSKGTAPARAPFVPQFRDFTDWASIALSTLGNIAGTTLTEPAASTARSLLDDKETKRTVVDPATHVETTVHFLSGSSVLHHGRVARVDPADATKFEIRISGRVCYPSDAKTPGRVAGKTPVPVVAIVHGQHEPLKFSDWVELDRKEVLPATVPKKFKVKGRATTITEVGNHTGYEYLQKELATSGIASISIDNNIHNFIDNLLDARAETLLTVLDTWKRQVAADPTDPCHGMLDFQNVGFMGHSRGGDAVVRAAKKNRARTANQYGLKAVCSLSPTDFTGSASSSAMVMEPADNPIPKQSMTYLVVYGALDGDVKGAPDGTIGPHSTFGGTGFRFYDRATCQKAMVFVKGACHNRFNTNWGTEREVITSDPTLLTPGKHLEASTFYIGGFFRWQLLGDTALRDRFTRDVKPPSGVTVALQWSLGEVTPIDTFEHATHNAFGVKRLMPFGSVIKFKDLRVDVGGTSTPQGLHIPHVTSIIDANLMVRIPMPRLLIDSTPVPLTKVADWDGFTYLTFRLGRWFDVTKDKFTGNRPRVQISLRDDTRKEVRVNESEFFPPDVPTKPFLHDAHNFDPVTDAKLPDHRVTLLHLETVRVPLSLYRKRGVNLKLVRDVGIYLEQKDNTHVFIDSLELVRI